ncbi:DinB family protein [Maribacter sp. 2-571]|uniref:DinB family protein n=1 Tax=Maribacter sp. 2-571 TaxID=3417569 RepID=UPI003D34CF34
MAISQLIDTATEYFEGTPWLGDSLMLKLNRIDFRVVNATFPNSQNSIARIVKHILNWRLFMIAKLEGDNLFDIEMNTDQDWTPITIKTEAEWNDLLHQLTETQSRLLEILQKQEKDSFLENKTLGREYSLGYLINGVIQHDTYHSGQIGLLYAYLKNQN